MRLPSVRRPVWTASTKASRLHERHRHRRPESGEEDRQTRIHQLRCMPPVPGALLMAPRCFRRLPARLRSYFSRAMTKEEEEGGPKWGELLRELVKPQKKSQAAEDAVDEPGISLKEIGRRETVRAAGLDAARIRRWR
jgi:hypothetical protein